jgi:hypothetical protein
MKEGRKLKVYEKPVMKKETKMIFPIEIINSNGQTIVCRQCSSCHGCK